jgi:hypothetical protein
MLSARLKWRPFVVVSRKLSGQRYGVPLIEALMYERTSSLAIQWT